MYDKLLSILDRQGLVVQQLSAQAEQGSKNRPDCFQNAINGWYTDI